MGSFMGLADDSMDLQQSIESYLDRYHKLEDPIVHSLAAIKDQLDDVIDGAVTKAARGFDQTTAW
jgi:hypothetical protein